MDNDNMRIITLFFIIILIPPGINAAEPNRYDIFFDEYFDTGDYCFQRISDTLADLWLAHSNRMAFGRPFRMESPYPDDEEDLSYQFDVYDSLYAWCQLSGS